ncbi:MAG: methylated-DNA--[protein]-cysteine S-methyltransferase [Firmicutes bacterium]|nr:methylated-DNA--[protein]-cysteine S-methyltransferase [Bacillota bacterium]
MLVYGEFKAPFGATYIVLNESGVRNIFLLASHWEEYLRHTGLGQGSPIIKDQIFCREAVRELEEYFYGGRRRFTIPLAPEGTEFQKKVWNALLAIPYGETRSYAEIAAAIGNPKAQRAIGQANRQNPLPILIPCHRVTGKDGALTGYLGGHLAIKRFLLQLEKGDFN